MKHTRLFVIALFFTICTIPTFGQQMMFKDAKLAREHSFDILKYSFNITINEKEKSVSGTVTVRFNPLRPDCKVFELDQDGLTFTSAAIGDKQLRFFTEGSVVKIPLDKTYGIQDTLSVAVTYSAKPKKGLYFIPPDSSRGDKYWQVWSQGESEENHSWFPCYDYPNDKASTEMVVTVNENFTAISNGALMDEKNNGNGTKTFHYMEPKPFPSYLISVVAGNYVKIADMVDGLSLEYYVPPAQKANAMRTFSKTPAMLKYFSEKIGFDYPWEKYTQTVVSDYMYGGMENTTATILTDGVLHDARAHIDYKNDGLISHELAHQWWGDVVSARDWSHIWLQESFAAYFEELWKEHDLGSDELTWGMLGIQRGSLGVDAEFKRPIVWNGYTDPEEVFDGHNYSKGSAVLHMLRNILGEELWWKSIHHFYEKNAFRSVETNDFKIAIEEATGYNLDWFFNEWLYKAGIPEFSVQESFDDVSNKLSLTVKQTQLPDSLTGTFVMPVNVEFFTATGSKVEQIWVDRRTKVYTFPFDDKPLAVVFDKGSVILKKLDFEQTTDELIYLLEHGDVAARLEALDQLKKKITTEDSTKIVTAISYRLTTDPFWGVKANAAEALGALPNMYVAQKLLTALTDENSRIRASAVKALEHFSGDNILTALKKAFNEDSSYTVASLALSALTRMDPANLNLYCDDALKRDSYQEIFRKAALQAYAQKSGTDGIKIVMSHTLTGHSTQIRTEAISILSHSTFDSSQVIKHLGKLVNDPIPQVRRAAVYALENYVREDALAILKLRLSTEADNRIRRTLEEAIKSIEDQI